MVPGMRTVKKQYFPGEVEVNKKTCEVELQK